MRNQLMLLALGFTTATANAQQKDSLGIHGNTPIHQVDFSIKNTLADLDDRKKTIKSILIPGVMITYGFVTLVNNSFKNLNVEVKEEIWSEHLHKLNHIDNYLLFMPAVSVYGLNALGIHGKNNLRDRSLIYLMSNIILNTTVYSLKKISHQLRPDGFDYNSFPSGHTAEAFASAEFMRYEYKEVSPWYGVAGYAMATATGFLRMYNNKHWLGDVVAGAGFGILSTKLAYWIYPAIKRKFFKNNPVNTMIMPYYQNGRGGLALVYNFH